MKISFQRGDEPQKPVSTTQQQMKNTQVGGLPVKRLFIGVVIMAALVYLAYNYIRGDAIHTYGLVASKIDEKKATGRCIVTKLLVKPGDHVKKGQLLYSTAGEDQTPKLEAAQTELNNLRASLEDLQKQKQTNPALADEVRRLQNLKSSLSEQKIKLEEAAKFTSDAENNLELQIKQNEVEVKKLEDFLAQKTARWEDLKKLNQLDAAVKADVTAAENEVNLAKRNLEQAKNALDFAQKNIQTAKEKRERDHTEIQTKCADLEKQIVEQEAVIKRFVEKEEMTLKALIAESEAKYNILKQTVKSTEGTALFDGIVTEVRVVEGSQVEEGAIITTIQDSNSVWVETYIAPNKRSRIDKGTNAVIYPQDYPRDTRDGEIATFGIEVRVPTALQKKLSQQPTGIYCRIALKDTNNLLPGNVVKVVIR